MAPRGWVWEPSAVCWQSYVDSPSRFAPLGTQERQSLCESHRQRRWLTYWSYSRPWGKPHLGSWRRNGSALLRIANGSACRADLFARRKRNSINCVRRGRHYSLQAQGDFRGIAFSHRFGLSRAPSHPRARSPASLALGNHLVREEPHGRHHHLSRDRGRPIDLKHKPAICPSNNSASLLSYQ